MMITTIPVHRALLNYWMQRKSRTIKIGGMGRCLEWDIRYSRIFDCKEKWSFKFEKDAAKWVFDYNRRKIAGDIHYFDQFLPEKFFDLIIATQVFEHLAEPLAAMVQIARILRPGGSLLWSAPQIFNFHAYPFDLYRYTLEGARHMIEANGLEVVDAVGLGDRVTSFMQILEIPARLLPREWLYRTSNDYYLNGAIHALRRLTAADVLRGDPEDIPTTLAAALAARDPAMAARLKRAQHSATAAAVLPRRTQGAFANALREEDPDRAAIHRLQLTPEQQRREIAAVTAEDVASLLQAQQGRAQPVTQTTALKPSQAVQPQGQSTHPAMGRAQGQPQGDAQTESWGAAMLFQQGAESEGLALPRASQQGSATSSQRRRSDFEMEQVEEEGMIQTSVEVREEDEKDAASEGGDGEEEAEDEAATAAEKALQTTTLHPDDPRGG